MKSLDVYIDGNHITTEDELHKFLIYKFEEDMRNINVEETNIQNDEYRGNKKKSKKKNQECKPQGPKPVCLKYMHPYKIETEVGCKQMIFGVLVDSKGHPINNPIIELELSDYRLGNLSFSPAISFHDGYFFSTFIAESCGCGELKLCCKGTDLNKVIPIIIESNYSYY